MIPEVAILNGIPEKTAEFHYYTPFPVVEHYSLKFEK
jgi:hypothetical protein